jgi:hypothetical protein
MTPVYILDSLPDLDPFDLDRFSDLDLDLPQNNFCDSPSSESSVCFSPSLPSSPASPTAAALADLSLDYQGASLDWNKTVKKRQRKRQHDDDKTLESTKAIPTKGITGNSTPRKGKESNKINEAEWADVAVPESLYLLQFGEPSQEITEADFEMDHKRVSLPVKLLTACKKLPWFHQLNVRFRQTLAKKRRHGVTLQDVVRAMNFLFRRAYSDDEINFLGNYFQKMEVPINAECLSSIVEVAEDFNRYLESVVVSEKKRARVVSELVDAHDHNSQLLLLANLPAVTAALDENMELLTSHQEICQHHRLV